MLKDYRENYTNLFVHVSHFQILRATRAGSLVRFDKKTNTVIAHCKIGGKVDVDHDMA
jgi:hypothetical protein